MRVSVSLLFATLAGRSIGVAAKGVKVIVERDRTEAPHPPLFLERYDSIEVRGCGVCKRYDFMGVRGSRTGVTIRFRKGVERSAGQHVDEHPITFLMLCQVLIYISFE
jgi:hypothetical protein